jgi:hypothetical protein
VDTLLIQEIYRDICKLPLPFEGGKEINGIHLTLMDADITGLLSRAKRVTQFTSADKAILVKCIKDLETVFPFLTEAEAAYFSKHKLACSELAKGIQS